MSDAFSVLPDWVALAVLVAIALVVLWHLYSERHRIWLQLPHLDARSRHGVVWVQASNGAEVPYNFRVDRPQLLCPPTERVLRQLIDQARRKGYRAVRIEVDLQNRTRWYSVGPKGTVRSL